MVTKKSDIIVNLRYRYRNEWREKGVTLADVAEWTRSGKYQRRVDAVRGLDALPTKGGAASGLVAAEELPIVRPAVGPRGDYTGLVLLSFRVTQGQEVLGQLRRLVELWPQTLMAFTGTSGQSLKVLIAYRLLGGGLPKESSQVALFQQYAYKRAAEFALGSTGVRVEEVVHDGTEHFRLSADAEVYYNPEAMAIEMEQPTVPLTELTAPVVRQPEEVALDTKVLPGYTRREMEVTKFNFICRELSFDKQKAPETYLAQLAAKCRGAGIDQELATQLAISIGGYHAKETLVRTTFTNAYDHHRLGVRNPVDKSTMYQQLLEEFLRRRYMFRRNRVTGDVEYQEKFRYELWWKPLTDAARNDINNAAIREGIKVWPQDLERIVVSEHTEEYDPVAEWLSRLPKWDGRDRLGEMADRVPTRTPSWRENFKVWMRAMVSQWRSGADALYGAQMVLMFVGDQGTRKSTFMRMLLPPDLKSFYIDRVDFTNRKEALRALHRFLLINIDEYDQVSKAQTAFLKHLIQRTDVKERKLYTTTFEQQQRYAAFCATTNSLVPLKDESGSRRYMVVEVGGVIDTDTQDVKAIDYSQLYAQIVSELDMGLECAFTGEREQQIVAQNADYYETPSVVSIFEDHFRRPKGDDEVQLLSPTEILVALKLNPNNRSNVTQLGVYLRRNGFTKGKGANRRCYQVAARD